MGLPLDETTGDATSRRWLYQAVAEPVIDEPVVDDDDLTTPAPLWVLVAGAVALAGVVLTCFLIFWRGMGTAVRQSAVEAFGVALGILVVWSVIGAFVQSARHERARRSAR